MPNRPSKPGIIHTLGWQVSTSVSTTLVTFSTRGRKWNTTFTLTSVPEHLYGPYKNKVLAAVPHETSVGSWISRSAIYPNINHPWSQGWGWKFYLHVLDSTNRTTKTKLEATTELKRIGRIMDKRWFRFHTAHVRNMRMTVSRINMTQNREYMLNSLSDAPIPMVLNTNTE